MRTKGEAAKASTGESLVFDLRVLAFELDAVGISGQGFARTADHQWEAANARHFVHAGRCEAKIMGVA